MRIAIGNDHTAVGLKKEIMEHLCGKGHEVTDFGTDTPEVCDYPVYGKAVAESVAAGDNDFGILICGTGIGISLAANKVKGIRAAVCSEPYSAGMAKKHNHANIIAFGARVVGSEIAKMIVDSYMNAEFEGGIHERRVEMFMAYEREESGKHGSM